MNIVLSFGDLAPPGGYRTRVLGELHTLDRQDGLEPFLLLFDRDPAAFEQRYQGPVPYQVFRRSDVLHFYSAIRDLAAKSPIRLIHAHNLYSAALALSRRRRYRYRVVLDYHGRIPEEYVFLGKGGKASRRILELLEWWCVRRSDHIVVVSRQLAEYLATRYRIPAHKTSVIPCCANQSEFTWDPARREAVRKSMNLCSKLVCTHLGSFVEWYEPQAIVGVFERIRSEYDAHMLVITGNAEAARAYLATRLPKDSFTVITAGHDDVPALLNASDIGLLLLRSSPNIQTSSPAKFAEYLNCGLPVLISPNVGDFSELVVQEHVGAIVEPADYRFDASILHRAFQDRERLGAHCMTVGRHLTWEAFSGVWSKALSGR